MKNNILTSAFLFFFSAGLCSAQVAISTDNSNPVPSAMLEVKSTSKGLLPPRLTTAQMTGIQSPAAGLVIFNTDLKTLCWYDGTQWMQTTGSGAVFTCGNTVFYDGQVYHTATIGTQCWMTENLNAGVMVSIGSQQLNNSIVEKYCYDNNPDNCMIYGGIYMWNEAMKYINQEGAQGICPAGWHIPSDGELTTLCDFLGGNNSAGKKLKESGTTHWNSPNTGTNSSLFTALGSGYYYSNSITQLREKAYLWTSTYRPDVTVYIRELNNLYDNFLSQYYNLNYGFSVRCINNN
ncbi:MAG: hypothetical protein NTU44_03060 [Bacteroidetes bacterium]|nr:hypothetical protein [Bacteroidota bacterium]